MRRDRSIVGKVVGLEDLLRQRQSLIEASSARSSEVEVVSLASSSSISRSISPTKNPVRLNERCGPARHVIRATSCVCMSHIDTMTHVASTNFLREDAGANFKGGNTNGNNAGNPQRR